MNLLFTAFLMLCGLGAPVFATTAKSKGEIFLMLLAALVFAGAGIPGDALPDARWIGCLTAALAAVRVFRPDIRWVGSLWAGVLGGLLGVLLRAQGVPLAISLPLAAAAPACAGYLAQKNARFAPELMREDAMLAVIALALAVAVIPEVASGWQSAISLNRDQGTNTNQIIANWVLVLSAASVVLGGLYSLLRRR